MFVFVCAGCGAELTVPLSEVVLPVHAHQSFGNGLQLPVLMESGTFAVDPEPWGPPWRPWEEVDPDEATARGIYAPLHALSDGTPGRIVVAPGDVRGTRLIPENGGGYCCGLAGMDGPNMACEACDRPVASRIDDCSLWQAVWLEPDAVHRVRLADTAPLSWAELMASERSTPPFVPISRWGVPAGADHFWSWSPQWEAAAGRALAHLLAASRGRPVTVPGGLVGEVFQRTLDILLPAGPPARRAVPAGPERPAPGPGADILLVPVHPQTGEIWSPAGRATPARSAPLPFGVWRWLVSPPPPLTRPASGGMPDGVFRDHSPAPHPGHLFRADGGVFRNTLVRLPDVRSPWLREILDNLRPYERGGIF